MEAAPEGFVARKAKGGDLAGEARPTGIWIDQSSGSSVFGKEDHGRHHSSVIRM